MQIDKSLISGSTTLLVLSLLEDRDQYGYEMIKELEIKSEKVFVLKEGTLYPILHRLENDGLIKSYEQESIAGKKRKYYSLTKEGIKKTVFGEKIGTYIGGELNAFA